MKHDLLCFYRDNLIANSGTVGDWIDLAFVPQVLGVDLPERLQKWLAYKKQGLGIIDSSQEGAQMMNTIFNGFDDTVKAQSIQAIQLAIQSIQQQVSMITGVLPEALAQYEQRDAVSNVQLGVKTTMLLTKQTFDALDDIYKEANYDLLNLAKLVFPNGLTGTLVLGDYNETFQALPEYYTMTDFDIHIDDSSKSYQQLQALVGISADLIKGGAADLNDIANIVTATSISEVKQYISKSIAKKKQENDQITQLQQQIQQYEQNMKQMEQEAKQLQQQLTQAQNQIKQDAAAKIDIEKSKLALEKEKMENEKDYRNKTLELKQNQIDNQAAEIYDDNPYNNRIKAVI